MNVRITNITDGPGKSPREVGVYNKKLRPGKFLDVPARFVDEKVRRLEKAGYIAIGSLPPWYQDYKSRRLAAKDVNARIQSRKDYFARREEARKPVAKKAPSKPVEVAKAVIVDEPPLAGIDVDFVMDDPLPKDEKPRKKKR